MEFFGISAWQTSTLSPKQFSFPHISSQSREKGHSYPISGPNESDPGAEIHLPRQPILFPLPNRPICIDDAASLAAWRSGKVLRRLSFRLVHITRGELDAD